MAVFPPFGWGDPSIGGIIPAGTRPAQGAECRLSLEGVLAIMSES